MSNRYTISDYIDFRSVEAKLYSNGKDRYQTNFGLFMSVLSIMAIITFIIYFLYTFFTGKGVSILFYTQNVAPFSFNYDLAMKPFFFQLVDSGPSAALMSPQYLTIVPTLWSTDKKGVQTMTVLETEPCAYGRNIDAKWANISTVNLTTSSCLKQSVTPRLFYDPVTNENAFLNIYVQMCQNTTANSNFCYPRTQIVNLLQQGRVHFRYNYPVFKIDHFNLEAPMQDNLYSSFANVIYDLKVIRYDYLKLTNYQSDSGSVFEDFRTYSNYGRDTSLSTFEVLPNSKVFSVVDSYFLLKFQQNYSQIDIHTRVYIKLQQILASIGGMAQVIFVTSQIISQFVTYRMYMVDLSNSCIHHERGAKAEAEAEAEAEGGNKDNQNAEDKARSKWRNMLYRTNNSFMSSTPSRKFTGNINGDKVNCIENKVENADQVNNATNFNPNINNINNLNYSISPERKINKNFEPKEIRKLEAKDILFPCLRNKNRAIKRLYLDEKIERIVKSMLSSNTILKTVVDYEKLKSVLLDKPQLSLFNKIRNLKVEEHLKFRVGENVVNTNLRNAIDLKENARSEYESEDKITKSILTRLRVDAGEKS